MNEQNISFEYFTLPFMTSPDDEDQTDPDENDSTFNAKDLEQMEDAIPADATFLGMFENDVLNGRITWRSEHHYYIVPLKSQEFQWALFEIRWDDNWGRYEWSCDARGKGFANAEEAGKSMLAALFDLRNINFDDEDAESYTDDEDQDGEYDQREDEQEFDDGTTSDSDESPRVEE